MDMRHINKGKLNLVAYIWGIHTDLEIPRIVKQRDMGAKEGVESEDTKGQEGER